MRLKLENILKVESADIRLGGLTVIAGENSTGKSTIGKVLFSLIKADRNSTLLGSVRVYNRVQGALNMLRRQLSRFEQLPKSIERTATAVDNLINHTVAIESLEAELINWAQDFLISADSLKQIDVCFQKIRKAIYDYEHPSEAFATEFQDITKTEFGTSLTSWNKTKSRISYTDSGAESIRATRELEFVDGKLTNFHISEAITFDDATYIESPIYMHILNLLRSSRPMNSSALRSVALALGQEKVAYHLTDMAEKLMNESGDLPNLFHEEFGEIEDSIKKSISGEFYIDRDRNMMMFRENGHPVKPINVAAGVKSLGMLQRLIHNDDVTPFDVLIWDEPEIHLHPEWQLVFCDTILRLVKEGVPVVISSHSPYLIQGLRYFAALHGIEGISNYYLAVKNPETELVRFEEVNEDLNRIFSQLALPLQQIMNVAEARSLNNPASRE